MERRKNSGDLKGEDEFTVCEECSMGFCDECEHINDFGEDATEMEKE